MSPEQYEQLRQMEFYQQQNRMLAQSNVVNGLGLAGALNPFLGGQVAQAGAYAPPPTTPPPEPNKVLLLLGDNE